MNPTPSEQLEVLYERYCDGLLEPAEREELLRLLQNPLLRRRFAELSAYEVCMHEELQIAVRTEAAPRLTSKTQPVAPLLRRAGKGWMRRRASGEDAWGWAVWSAAACLLFAVGVALLTRGGPNREAVATKTPVTKQPEPIVNRSTAPNELTQQRERALADFKAARERERELQQRLQQLAVEKRQREEQFAAEQNANELEKARLAEAQKQAAERAAALEREAMTEIERARDAARSARETVVATTRKDRTLGRVTFIEKGVQAWLTRGAVRQPLAVDLELQAGDRISTTPVSTLPAIPKTDAAISLFSGAEIELAVGTELVLESLECVKVSRGLLFAEVDLGNTAGAKEKPYSLAFETPHASAMIVGTRFDLNCNSLETRLQMEEGEVTFSNAKGSQTVKAGEISSARASAAPSVPAALKTTVWRGRKKLESRALQLLRKKGELMINFGPEAEMPAGIMNDSGEPFDALRGYGWKGPKVGPPLPNGQHNGEVMREGRLVRGNPLVPDLINNGWVCCGWSDHTETWRMPVPNGRYLITISIGDGMDQGPNHVRFEEQVVVNAEMTGAEFLVKRDVPVLVIDGELTMTVGGHRTAQRAKDGSADTALNYLIIKMTQDE
ncbi:MAG TPA: hypothetical protein VEK08_05635 [Planctomycetota bacterium]|nr:hypothetical protein [Planctomycetota bacterium]